MFGVVEEHIIDQCEQYVVVGNTYVHRHKSIWSRPHHKMSPPWLFSRAVNGTPEFIAIFDGGKKKAALGFQGG